MPKWSSGSIPADCCSGTCSGGIQGNVATVDAVYGVDASASVGGCSFKTVEAAISAVNSAGSTGKTIYVLPGTYNLAAGITIPTGASIRGMSVQTCIIQMLSVTANTTLITMGENCRVEDLTLKLTSSGHYTLKGIVCSGTTSVTSKLRTCVLSVDNSAASSGGTSTVTGIEFNGTGTLGSGSFSFNTLKGSTINVYSNGGGKKRGILVSNTNVTSTRDVNVYVAQPTSTASTGSYVGVETADPANTGSIQLRSTTIGTVRPTAGQSYTASDILQTNPITITDPTYLASAGIQIGPGTDLVTKSAGSKSFSSYVYPTTIYYGLRGSITDNKEITGYLWPGTQLVNIQNSPFYPDTTTPAASYRVQQPSILSGISAALNTGPGTGKTFYVYTQYTPVNTSTVLDTSFNINFTGASGNVAYSYYASSLELNSGDKIHVYLDVSQNNLATDLNVQLDFF